MENVNNCSLSIRRGKNSFSPIEWTKLEINNNPNANQFSLEDIDAFTSGITDVTLIKELVYENFLSIDDYMSSIEIIYHENGNTRIIPEGPCFIEDSEYLDRNKIINFINLNITDLQLINKLYNYLKKYIKEDNHNYAKFVNLLNYVHEIVKEKDLKKVNALTNLVTKYINALEYQEIRRIGMYISKNLVITKEVEKPKKLIYNNDDNK